VVTGDGKRVTALAAGERTVERRPGTVVVGGLGLVADLVAELLAAEGHVIIDLTHAAGAEGSVAVLVDAQEPHWQAVHDLAVPVVLVSREELADGEVVEAVLRGADAIVNIDAGPEELLEVVGRVAAGGTILEPEHVRSVADAARARTMPPQVAEVRLTPREREILDSIGRGELVKQTARTLGISVKTVENLQRRLFRKLGARNRAHAVARAHALSLLREP
jgi:two-component system, NarL family, nitrate/nitrite response regulator NarL